jgi:hypothetical protein
MNNAKTIALVFIIKDEWSLAISMIKSVASMIDYVCFVDTESTNEAKAKIEDLLKSYSIPFKSAVVAFDNFSSVRNTALSLVPPEIDYILVLDADEAINKDDHDKVAKLINDKSFDGYYLPRKNHLKNGELLLYPDLQLRLFRNKGFLYIGDVHEAPWGGDWYKPGEDELNLFPHIEHFKYTSKSAEALSARESLYLEIYRQNGKKHKLNILRRLEVIPDPFENFEVDIDFNIDMQGMDVEHFYLKESIQKLRPNIIASIGCWKGAEVLFMVNNILSLVHDSTIIAVDTWLGDHDQWLDKDLKNALFNPYGMPHLYKIFLSNMVKTGSDNFVIPMPINSAEAAVIMKQYGIKFDIINLNCNSYKSVISDLESWWPLLTDGGCLICGNYYLDGHILPEVKLAFDEFFGVSSDNINGKCIIYKDAR